MRYIEIEGNLFRANSVYSLAHCISTDCEMGKGIAVEFDKQFPGMKSYLKSQNPKIGDSIGFKRSSDGRRAYNLVTKKDYWGKPTYETLEKTLIQLRFQTELDGCFKIAIPLIGSGLDRLNWNKVSELIKTVFRDSKIDIVVYKLRK